MKNLPIRLRLTSWYFVMFASAAILLSLTSWWMLRRTLDATIHQDLEERIDDVAMQLRQLGPDIKPESAAKRFDQIYRYRDDGKWLQIMAPDGSFLYRSERMPALQPAIPPAQTLAASGTIAEYAQAVRTVRVYSAPVVIQGRTYVVQTGISMHKPHALLHDFGLGLLLLTPAVLLAAAAGGHWMSRKALQPVAAIAFEARRITDRNLDTRLPVSSNADEISHLSTTLNLMLARIDVAFRSVRDFTANASHELRTPLARLRTETEIALLRPRDAGDYRRTLERVHQGTVDMSEVIDNLLTLARAEAGAEVLRLHPLDIGLLLRDILQEWRPITEQLSILLRPAEIGATETGAGLVVLGDRLSLLRLMRIWLDNACKYTPAGGTITILVRGEADAVVLAVEDSGVGIAREHHDRIFERFYRVSGDLVREEHSAGLGLSLAAWIAEQHKARIQLKSAPGMGSSFQISLQRVPSQKPEREQARRIPTGAIS